MAPKNRTRQDWRRSPRGLSRSWAVADLRTCRNSTFLPGTIEIDRRRLLPQSLGQVDFFNRPTVSFLASANVRICIMVTLFHCHNPSPSYELGKPVMGSARLDSCCRCCSNFLPRKKSSSRLRNCSKVSCGGSGFLRCSVFGAITIAHNSAMRFPAFAALTSRSPTARVSEEPESLVTRLRSSRQDRDDSDRAADMAYPVYSLDSLGSISFDSRKLCPIAEYAPRVLPGSSPAFADEIRPTTGCRREIQSLQPSAGVLLPLPRG